MSGRLEPGLPVTVAAGVTRLVAPNPSMMTGPGTNSYVLGRNGAVVIDPGPAIDRHIDALCELAPAAHAVIVTHTHPDHSPGAAPLAARTGAILMGRRAPRGRHQDSGFTPGRELEDGDSVAIDDVVLRVLHTPGHASNHLCFLREVDGLLFTGDHIINGSTVVIDPPDGNMAAYLRSLDRLKGEPVTRIAPGHGELLDEPLAAIDWLVAHRLEREAGVVAALAAHPGLTSAELTKRVYAAVDERLHAVAERSLLAHLEKLRDEGRARENGGHWQPAAG